MAADGQSLKEEGNRLMRGGDFDGAIAMYTRAIAADPRNHILYSNRSAAYAGRGAFEESLNDASSVCLLAPDWVKGHARKASALKQLGRLPEAIAAYERACALAPDSVDLAAALKSAQDEQASQHRANWADDLNSSGDESDKPASGKGGDLPAKRRRVAGERSSESAVAKLKDVLEGSGAAVLRACLLQMGKEDSEVCMRITQTLEELGDESSGKEEEEDVESDGDDDI